MELKDLQKHIRHLVTLEITEAPVISCYFNLEPGVADCRQFMEARATSLRKSLPKATQRHFEEALRRIDAYITAETFSESKGLAVFARSGDNPLFLPLQFHVPLPNWMVADEVPNVYHLVELKDTYHRYVVIHTTAEVARIWEINLGAVTEQIWRERPELQIRVDRSWTKEHYQHHRKAQTDQFINEKIKILDRLMSAGGHTHLILAGEPRMILSVQRALPKHLAAKLIDIVATTPKESISEVVAATISTFVAREEMESVSFVDRLQREVNANGPAVIGVSDSLNALRWGQADVLILAKAYEPEPGWVCSACGAAGLDHAKPAACSECGEKQIRVINVKEEMVRMAERNACKVEIVNHSEVLMTFGGVGCLLRYSSM